MSLRLSKGKSRSEVQGMSEFAASLQGHRVDGRVRAQEGGGQWRAGA